MPAAYPSQSCAAPGAGSPVSSSPLPASSCPPRPSRAANSSSTPRPLAIAGVGRGAGPRSLAAGECEFGPGSDFGSGSGPDLLTEAVEEAVEEHGGRAAGLRPSGFAVEGGSWPPAEADHDEEPTWADWVGYGSGRRIKPCERILGRSGGEKVERWREESAGHGRTCSRRLVAA